MSTRVTRTRTIIETEPAAGKETPELVVAAVSRGVSPTPSQARHDSDSGALARQHPHGNSLKTNRLAEAFARAYAPEIDGS